MNPLNLKSALEKLIFYCESEDFKGYDPYDTLNSFINFKILGKWGSSLAIQFQKLNPFNIRPVLGIKKDYNSKGIGLFLKSYCLIYKKTQQKEYLEQAIFLFNWLKRNYSKGYSGYAWGYNFDWATPGSYLKANTPSVVVTSFIIDGIFEYYQLTNDPEAKEIITSSAKYIISDIPVTKFGGEISFSYTHLSKGCCYNASLLAAEILAKADFVNNTTKHEELIKQAIKFVLSKQKTDGSWHYSFNPLNRTERNQIDFHQGFILISLQNLAELTGLLRDNIFLSVEKGLRFYKDQQFTPYGKSLWRLPKRWPIDIHNQSQGIITFSRLQKYSPEYHKFAQKIAIWTIENMQSKKGFFYYRKTLFFINRIPYIRWSQAWMSLALAEIIE